MIKGKSSCPRPSFGPSLGNKFPKELVAKNLSAQTILFRSSVPLEFFRGWGNGQRLGEVQDIFPIEELPVIGTCRMGCKVALLDIIHYGQSLLKSQDMGRFARADHFRFTDIFLITLGVHTLSLGIFLILALPASKRKTRFFPRLFSSEFLPKYEYYLPEISFRSFSVDWLLLTLAGYIFVVARVVTLTNSGYSRPATSMNPH